MWNYRVFKQVHKNGEIHFGIKETYYNEKKEVESWTQDDMKPYGENLKELKKCMKMMSTALKKPIINEKKLLKKLSLNN